MSDSAKAPPLSLNEAMIDRHFATDPYNGRAPIADPILAVLRGAMLHGREAAEKATRIAEAVLADEMQTLPSRHRRLKAEAWKAVEMPLKRFDAALLAARHEIEAIERKTMEPAKPNGAAEMMLASEVRARLVGMPEADRRATLETALAEGDDSVVGAVLHGPAMLSGMSAPQHAHLRDRWRAVRHAPEVDRVQRLKAAVADVERGGTLLVGHAASLADSAIIEKAEASEAAARAAIAS